MAKKEKMQKKLKINRKNKKGNKKGKIKIGRVLKVTTVAMRAKTKES